LPTRWSTSGRWASGTSRPASLPGLLQSQFGYDAYVSGLVQSPSGIFSVMGLFVVGAVIGRGVDARWLIAGGLLVMAAGNYWMALMNLYISPGQVIWPRVVLITGLSMIFAPINVAAFKYIPLHLRGAAVGLFSLLCNEGGSVGTSLAPALEWRREHFHTSRVGEFLDPLNPVMRTRSFSRAEHSSSSRLEIPPRPSR
jgi:MFS transporter, DHA2 family, multidrug resistance protein